MGVLQSKDKNTKHILCIGDSLTFGFCHRFAEPTPYGKEMEKILKESGTNVKIQIEGVCGETTEKIKLRLESFVNEKSTFDIVFILGGTNDIGTAVPLEQTRENLKSMYEHCIFFGIRTIVLNLPSRTDPKDWWIRKRQNVNDEIDSMFNSDFKDSKYISLVDISDIMEGRMAPKVENDMPVHDQLHPGPDDYKEIGIRCAKEASRILTELSSSENT